MNNLGEATERICELKGSLLALQAFASALAQVLPAQMRCELGLAFDAHTEVARTVMLHAPISEHTIAAFERDVRRTLAIIDDQAGADRQ